MDSRTMRALAAKRDVQGRGGGIPLRPLAFAPAITLAIAAAADAAVALALAVVAAIRPTLSAPERAAISAAGDAAAFSSPKHAARPAACRASAAIHRPPPLIIIDCPVRRTKLN